MKTHIQRWEFIWSPCSPCPLVAFSWLRDVLGSKNYTKATFCYKKEINVTFCNENSIQRSLSTKMDTNATLCNEYSIQQSMGTKIDTNAGFCDEYSIQYRPVISCFYEVVITIHTLTQVLTSWHFHFIRFLAAKRMWEKC